MDSDQPINAPATAREGDFDAQVNGVASLGEPLRRALYRYVVAQPSPVNRDQAGEAVGVARHTAKFHLDKLVDDGLLEIEFARPPGRRGPGAGRPAKLYRRSSLELAVSLPERHYELAGRLLAKAVTDAQRDAVPVVDALAQASRVTGRSLGDEARQRDRKRATRSGEFAATAAVLSECGYEPRADGAGLVLANCPFHALAQEYTDLVCGMNLELLGGVLDGLGESGLAATLDPEPGRCCVRISKS